MAYNIKVKTGGNVVACDICQDFDAVKRWILSMDFEATTEAMQHGASRAIGVKVIKDNDITTEYFGVMARDLEDGVTVKVQAPGDNRVIEITKDTNES